VASCAPGNPIANAATAIGEFLQDVPKLLVYLCGNLVSKLLGRLPLLVSF
jgi:hypothetical protein